jgi:hypothetical protein
MKHGSWRIVTRWDVTGWVVAGHPLQGHTMSRTRNWTPDPLTKLKAVVTSVKKRQRLGANNGNVIPHPDFLSAREGGKLYNHFQGFSDMANTSLSPAASPPAAGIPRDHS